MRLEPTPRPEQTLRVNARLITSSTILHLASDEIEQAIAQEQMENPALAVSEQRVCLFCGAPYTGRPALPVAIRRNFYNQPSTQVQLRLWMIHPLGSSGATIPTMIFMTTARARTLTKMMTPWRAFPSIRRWLKTCCNNWKR